MSRVLRVPVLLLLFLSPAPGLSSSGESAAAAGGLAERIDAYVEPFLADEHLSGQLLVAREGAVLYERSFGMANFELGVPVTSETRFNVASISKPMTGMLALQLVQSGKLAASDPLSKWIPDFPRGDEITLEMLMRHTAGIPHRLTSELEESQPTSAAGMVELAKGAELLFEPGQGSAYSSGGYSILARVLELASGSGYGELIERSIFAPAGMEHSVHPEGDYLIPARADSYLLGPDGGIRNAALKHYSFLVGAGSIYSTPRDLLALQRALLDGKLGEQAIQNYVRDSSLSWNGRTNGFRAFADFDGQTGVSVIFAGNLLTGAADRLRADVPRIAAGEAVEVPSRLNLDPVTVPATVLREYEGVYQLRPGTELELSFDGNSVSLSGWTLIPTSESSFFSPQDYARISVVRAADGTVERLDWAIGDDVYPMPRLGPLPGD
jgi:CubicO group peptidase (beta-lactamase class C family)